jgi:hypothetical protein
MVEKVDAMGADTAAAMPRAACRTLSRVQQSNDYFLI